MPDITDPNSTPASDQLAAPEPTPAGDPSGASGAAENAPAEIERSFTTTTANADGPRADAPREAAVEPVSDAVEPVSDAPLKKPRKTIALDSPGGGKRWRRFFARLFKVLLRPAAFWEQMSEEEVSIGEIMWPHVIVMIGLRSAAGFSGSMLADGDWVSGLVAFGSSFVSWIALVWVFAIIVGSVATTRGARINAIDPLAFAAYGLAPVFIVGMLAVIPLPYVAPIAELVAMPYTFHVMALGVVPLLNVRLEHAPAVVGLLCGLLLILWGIMPTLVPLAMQALTR